MKELILTVGLPGSGKTTWALGQGLPVVSPEHICSLKEYGRSIRELDSESKWQLEFDIRLLVQSMFDYGFDKVILDSQNLTIADRAIWANTSWKRSFEYVYCPLPFCKQRVTDRDLEDDFSMDELEAMAKRLEVPSQDELEEWELV